MHRINGTPVCAEFLREAHCKDVLFYRNNRA